MSTKKLKMEDILIPGAKLTARILDLNDSEIRKYIKEIQEAQEKILGLKNIDLEKLSHTYITI